MFLLVAYGKGGTDDAKHAEGEDEEPAQQAMFAVYEKCVDCWYDKEDIDRELSCCELPWWGEHVDFRVWLELFGWEGRRGKVFSNRSEKKVQNDSVERRKGSFDLQM